MTAITCDGCGSKQDDGQHWIHASVYHHSHPDYEGDFDKHNPRNFAAALCPDCGRDVIDAMGGNDE